MSVTKVSVEEFISLSRHHPVIDVRSEGEYQHAHIPSAISLPLFNDEERKIVGTAYKQQSRKAAIKIGLDFFGNKMRPMVEEVEKLLEGKRKAGASATANIVLVHCWRGGMRSGAVAWLLDMYGFKVYALAGGYKAFRNWALQQFELDYNFFVLGGYTGSGKTYVLNELKNQGEAVIDLEHLASHKGSSFGNINLPPQPSQEMFENMLAVALSQLESDQVTDDREERVGRYQLTDESKEQGMQEELNLLSSNNRPHTITYKSTPSASNVQSTRIWIEDESRRIGTVNIPTSLWKTIRQRPVYFLQIDFEERLLHIVQEYGKCDKEKLVDAIIRIQKRLGGLESKTAISFLEEDDVEECFRILLKYYDKQYLKALHNRDASAPVITEIICESVDVENAKKLLEAVNK